MYKSFYFFRHGGGTGSGDIRKIAYFEQSIDPEILKVNLVHFVPSKLCPL